MSELYTLPPFGLKNNNTNCYLNSIMQLLFSCDIINDLECSLEEINDYFDLNNTDIIKKLDKNIDKEKFIKIKKDIISTMITIMNSAQSLIQDGNISKMNRTTIPSISSYIINELRTTNDPYLMSVTSGQQSVCEIFDLLIDILGVESAFKFEYERILICQNCGKKSVNIDIDYCFRAFDSSKDKSDLNKEILGETIELTDFVCEKCGKKNVINDTKLSSIPNNIVVVFNKYEKKINLHHPNELTFISRYGDALKYDLVTQIEHHGSINSGHYYALLKRKGIVYSCDDTEINVVNMNLRSTNNTYIALYRKISKDVENRNTRRSMLAINDNDLFR